MNIAVCSDIHDNVWALEKALPQIAAAGDALVFCGDFCAPFTLVQLAEGFRGPLHVVWGNNDGDRHLLTQMAGRFEHVTLHGELARLELGGLRIGVNHYPDVATSLAGSGDFDLVLYGHDHVAHQERRQLAGGATCLLVNPGELMGRFGRRTFGVVDTEARNSRLVDIDAA